MKTCWQLIPTLILRALPQMRLLGRPTWESVVSPVIQISLTVK
jgi:hypothetical protein